MQNESTIPGITGHTNMFFNVVKMYFFCQQDIFYSAQLVIIIFSSCKSGFQFQNFLIFEFYEFSIHSGYYFHIRNLLYKYFPLIPWVISHSTCFFCLVCIGAFKFSVAPCVWSCFLCLQQFTFKTQIYLILKRVKATSRKNILLFRGGGKKPLTTLGGTPGDKKYVIQQPEDDRCWFPVKQLGLL